jgi:hypothetical protein
MFLFKYFFLLLILLFSTQCSKAPLDISKCNNLKTTSVEYLNCLNNLYTSTNTAKNLREFKKHKTLKSFFKQVEVIESN